MPAPDDAARPETGRQDALYVHHATVALVTMFSTLMPAPMASSEFVGLVEEAGVNSGGRVVQHLAAVAVTLTRDFAAELSVSDSPA